MGFLNWIKKKIVFDTNLGSAHPEDLAEPITKKYEIYYGRAMFFSSIFRKDIDNILNVRKKSIINCDIRSTEEFEIGMLFGGKINARITFDGRLDKN